jgi:hypothetical protein
MATASPELAAFEAAFRGLSPDELKELIERRHPEFYARLKHWDFCEATYVGGPDWFNGNIFKYVKEGPNEYAERVQRAYRFPHTREVVDLINKYIFKAPIKRDEKAATPEVKAFWKQATINRRAIDDLMRLASERASYLGRPWLVMDTNQTEPNATVLSQKENGARLYAYIVKPQHVLDLGTAEDGDVQWVKLFETHRDDESVFGSGKIATRFRIWTKNHWALFEQREEKARNGKPKLVYVMIDAGEHGLGVVPAFPLDHIISDSPYFAMSLVDDIAYLDRAVANYLSNLDAIIQDQAFSQLTMPAQALMPGEDGDAEKKLLELGTKRILTYDGQSPNGPEYISPDPKQAGMILAVINKIINEIYHSVGMAGERTKQDNAMGIDNSSGVAKAFDFERLNAVLTSKAHSLQIAENRLCELVDIWHGADPSIIGTYNLVQYPDSFDTRGLSEELAIASQLALVQAPDKLRQEQMKALADKLLPHVADDLIAAIKAEIDSSWPPEPVEATSPNSPPSGFSGEKRQGQNNGENKG